MIVQYKIKEAVYEATSKQAIPVMIVAHVPTPEPPLKQADVRLDMAHYNFIHKNENELIQRMLKELDESGGCFFDDILYHPNIITLADPDNPDMYQDGIIAMSTTHSDEHMKRRLIADDILQAAAAMALDNDDGPCLCCSLTESIYGQLIKYQGEHAINCPNCGKAIAAAALEPIAIQEANYYEPYHHIGIHPASECPHCGAHFALIPTPIGYNGNHDVYYTGGAAYMEDKFEPKTVEAELYELFHKHVFASIKNYVDRKLSGEQGLSEWNLKVWTERDFAAAFCEYFYNHGLKE